MPDRGISASVHLGPVGPRLRLDAPTTAEPNAAPTSELYGVHLHEYAETIWDLVADDPADTYDYETYRYIEGAEDWILQEGPISVTGNTTVSQRNDGDYTYIRLYNIVSAGGIQKYARGSNPGR